MDDARPTTPAAKAYKAALKDAIVEGCKCEACTLGREILKDAEYLGKKSVWIFGGDGWAYDIGFGGVDHVLASGEDVNVSSSTPRSTPTPADRPPRLPTSARSRSSRQPARHQGKKSLAEIAMSYGYVYVAQVAMGANAAQTIKAIEEAEAYHGPSLIIGYAPCEMHSIKGGMANCQKEMKKAVDCGYWNMFRFNPAAETGKKFTLDSKAPAGGYQEFLMNEARYSRLTREFPDRASVLFAKNEENAKERYEHLLKLIELYDK
jgi:pyruvate-ferredoxin/flavodoxin oxidoreductase